MAMCAAAGLGQDLRLKRADAWRWPVAFPADARLDAWDDRREVVPVRSTAPGRHVIAKLLVSRETASRALNPACLEVVSS